MRSPDELLASALAVIDRAFSTPAVYVRRVGEFHVRETRKYPEVMVPLYSGGHDSGCAVHVASKHPRWDGRCHFINTGIGAKRTLQHARETAEAMGWKFKEYRSHDTYEKFVRERGFPGPAMHQWAYIRLKERCVRMMVKGKRVALITGCRSQESVRRMGTVEPVKVGEAQMRNGKEVVENLNRTWVAPCHDWTSEEQAAYMEEHDLPRNPVKLALGMSGECFCGAFASPGEYERIRRHVPDVADEIDRLAEIARACGKHAVWGTRPPGSEKGEEVAASGPLCSTCDLRAAAAGVVFKKPCG